MTRVIHTGDTHVGYRQYHSPERRDDFLDAFRQVAADAIADEADAVVHAGDLFHDRRPDLGDVYGTIAVLRRLREGGVPVLCVVGNHERTHGRQWVDLFASLDLVTRLGREPTVIGDVAFYGLDFVPRSRRDDLDYDFAPHDESHAALVAHGPFEPFVPDVRADRWDLAGALDASPVTFDVALLGDDHTPDTTRVDGTWATYCGSTERTDASEREPRGYNIVTFDDDVEITRRGIETRPFVFVDLNLDPEAGPERVIERVRQEDVEDAVVVVTLTGDGEPIPAARIEEVATEHGALVARVNDRREGEMEAAVPEVSFADPDDAVRERLRERSLSEAARGIDSTVRDLDGIPDSNVRERVKESVSTLLEENPDALVASVASGSTEDAGADTTGTSACDQSAEAGEMSDTSTDAEGVTEPDPSGNEEEPAPPGDAQGSDPQTETRESDRSPGQATTMEDFL